MHDRYWYVWRHAMPDLLPIDIRPNLWRIVRDILCDHVPRYEVWAFGSRVKGPYSDLDLAIISDTPLPLRINAALDGSFSESDLPWRVDGVDWATTSVAFRKITSRTRLYCNGRESDPTGTTRGFERRSDISPLMCRDLS